MKRYIEFGAPHGGMWKRSGFPNLEAALLGFLEVLLLKHDRLNHWTLAIDLIAMEVRGQDWKFPLSIHRLAPLAASPQPTYLPKVTSFTEQKTPFWLSSLRKPEGFRSSVPDTGMRTEYVFLPVNQCYNAETEEGLGQRVMSGTFPQQSSWLKSKQKK